MMSADDAANHRQLRQIYPSMSVGDGRCLAVNNFNGDFVQIAADGKVYIPYTNISYWGNASAQQGNYEVLQAGLGDGANFNLDYVSSAYGLAGYLKHNDDFWRGANGKYYSSNSLYKEYWGKGGKYTRGVQGLRNSANTARTASANLAKAGRLFGAASVVLTIWDGAADGNFSSGDIAKTLIGVGTVICPVGWAYGILDFGVQITTGESITDRVGGFVDKHW
jgi:hypothetical protein